MKLRTIAALVLTASCFSFALPSYANDMNSFKSNNVPTQITKTIE